MKNTAEKIMADYDLELFSHAKEEPCLFSPCNTILTFLGKFIKGKKYPVEIPSLFFFSSLSPSHQPTALSLQGGKQKKHSGKSRNEMFC